MSSPLVTRFASRSLLAPGVEDLRFTMVEPPALGFRAGQYVTVLMGQQADGTLLKRSYSLASRSDDGGVLRFIIRLIDGGAASLWFEGLAVGHEVRMTGPHGFFVLDAQHAGDVVFAATGTGMAAVLPMLAELAGRSEPGRRLVFWGVRHDEDVFARDEIEAACRAAGAALTVFASQPTPAWAGARGRITPAVMAAVPGLHAPVFYLVGNGAMINDLKRDLQAHGVDRRKQIRTEAFFT